MPQINAGPLADIVPPLDADVTDDELLLRQRVDLRRGPRPLVLDEAGKLELPAPGVDRLHLLDLVIGVEARRFHHSRLGIGRHQMVRPEQEGLDQIVPARHGRQHALHRAAVGDIATGQQRQGAKADAPRSRLRRSICAMSVLCSARML